MSTGTPTNKINVGVVGATGVVGETFINLIEQRQFPVGDIKLFASDASLGSTLTFKAKEYPISTLSDSCFAGLDVVFFSAGEAISKKWAPIAVTCGAFAIDNSSAFRIWPCAAATLVASLSSRYSLGFPCDQFICRCIPSASALKKAS